MAADEIRLLHPAALLDYELLNLGLLKI